LTTEGNLAQLKAPRELFNCTKISIDSHLFGLGFGVGIGVFVFF
jgi:hypothetical protein